MAGVIGEVGLSELLRPTEAAAEGLAGKVLLTETDCRPSRGIVRDIM